MEVDSNQPESNVKSTIDAVTGLVKAIPVYQDTLQPSAKQIGKSLETVTKTVNIALAPIKALVWGYEKIEEFISSSVSEKLKNVPHENISTPPPQIAGPAIEALRFSGHDINLRELYANLLANAMDATTIHQVHPGFVEIIKNMTSDEALVMQCFVQLQPFPLIDVNAQHKDRESGFAVFKSNYSHIHKHVTLQLPHFVPAYLDNLCRLGILEIPSGQHITNQNTYEPLENDPELEGDKRMIELVLNRIVTFQRKVIRPTVFGSQFVRNVVIDKS
jgi:hypothetical protein